MSYSVKPHAGSPFSGIRVGAIATRFGERITKVVHAHRNDRAPQWFDPRHHCNHLGIHIRDYAVYIEVEVNEEQRTCDQPFDTPRRRTAHSAPQLDLFALIDQPCIRQ